jgi:hypothetical protein
MKKLHFAMLSIGSLVGGLILERVWYFYPATLPKFLISPLQNFVLLFAKTEESADDLTIIILIVFGTLITSMAIISLKSLISFLNRTCAK